MSSNIVFGFPIIFVQHSKILHDRLRLKLLPTDGVLFKTFSVKICINNVNISRRISMKIHTSDCAKYDLC
jgi:hypothetical protein